MMHYVNKLSMKIYKCQIASSVLLKYESKVIKTNSLILNKMCNMQVGLAQTNIRSKVKRLL
jgi:hypothetical protein